MGESYIAEDDKNELLSAIDQTKLKS